MKGDCIMEELIKEEAKAMKIEAVEFEELESIVECTTTKIVGMPNYVSISDNSNINGKKIKMIKQYSVVYRVFNEFKISC